MALEIFNWQNGSLVEPAKVEIDGIAYEVTEAQYEGETPLSSANLNQMQTKLLSNVVDDLDDDTKIPSVKAVKGKILWTNNSPTTAMTDGTQINLSSSDYDMLEVICEYSTSNRDLIFSFKGLKGKNIGLLVNSCNNTLTTVGRIMTYANDTKYTLSTGHMNIGTSTTVSDNTSGCIPLYIIGYKTGLF